MQTDAAELRAQLAAMPLEDLARLAWRAEWKSSARPNQLPPDEVMPDWDVWMILSGRGWGKTHTGAEWIANEAWEDPGSYNFVVAPTYSDLIGVCFEGPSGILNIVPSNLIAKYTKDNATIVLVNGSIIRGFSATEPNRLRGPQCHRIWMDELAAYGDIETAWDMASFGRRLVSSRANSRPRTLITTTPRPLKFIRDLAVRAGVHVTTGSTYENKANLAPSFFADITRYEGTSLGRQEIHGEILDMSEQGVFKRSWFKLWPNDLPFPRLKFIVQSYDTAFKQTKRAHETACTTWGVFRPNRQSPLGVMCLDAWADKMEYPELREKAMTEYGYRYGPEERPVDMVIVEDKAAGQSLIQDLQRAKVPLWTYNPGRDDKLLRANVVSDLVKNGLVWLPESTKVVGQPRTWLGPFLDQVTTFGPATFGLQPDDYVDTFTQMLAYVRDGGYIVNPRDPIAEDDYEPRERSNPYAA